MLKKKLKKKENYIIKYGIMKLISLMRIYNLKILFKKKKQIKYKKRYHYIIIKKRDNGPTFILFFSCLNKK